MDHPDLPRVAYGPAGWVRCQHEPQSHCRGMLGEGDRRHIRRLTSLPSRDFRGRAADRPANVRLADPVHEAMAAQLGTKLDASPMPETPSFIDRAGAIRHAASSLGRGYRWLSGPLPGGGTTGRSVAGIPWREASGRRSSRPRAPVVPCCGNSANPWPIRPPDGRAQFRSLHVSWGEGTTPSPDG